MEQQGAKAFDPEEHQCICLNYKESEGALNEHTTSLYSVLKITDVHCHQYTLPMALVSHLVAKLILVNFQWQVAEILDRYKLILLNLSLRLKFSPVL